MKDKDIVDMKGYLCFPYIMGEHKAGSVKKRARDITEKSKYAWPIESDFSKNEVEL